MKKYKLPGFFLLSILILLTSYQSLRSQGSSVIILTSDQQLNDLMDPDRRIDISLGLEKQSASLREVCESGRKAGNKTLIVAFDEFFRQYRSQAGTERKLTPDMDEYIEKIKSISDFASQYGMGIELSLLSPLELGPAYLKNTGECGRWLGYKTAYRDPESGKFSLQMWQQLYWTNNKGKFEVRMKGVHAYAFRQKMINDSPFRAVNPDDIIELKNVHFDGLDTVRVRGSGELVDGGSAKPGADYMKYRNLRIYSDGEVIPGGFNHVFALIEYETSEMDYFSPKATPFLNGLLKKYHDKGINLVSLYSDEMHIQQDWHYFTHHENGQFNMRYLTHSFSEEYRNRFGQSLDDRDLLYFVFGAPSYGVAASDARNIQYVMGTSPEDIQKTFLLRDRYYKMLNSGVTDLFMDAKGYAETLFGRELRATGHSSWAESPTIDMWETERLSDWPAKYEYTSNYVWGNTVHQAAAACYDYFKWGEYLEPTGNDFAECGWLDRNYYGAAMAASIGVINKNPDAYAAAWGMPDKSMLWKIATNSAFGARDGSLANTLTGNVHRDIEVLILYPMNLVAAEERFGSWMTQYAYANYLTSEKLLELGKITSDGYITVKDKKYNTLVAIFEPLPPAGLISFMNEFTNKGGSVIWCSCPPLLDGNGKLCADEWSKLFGVSYKSGCTMGEIASGREVRFSNELHAVPDQTILTDFLVDRIYPVTADEESSVVAESGEKIIGTVRQNGAGHAWYLGFRPRDDQSASLGYETRTLFEILNAAGSYPASGKFPGVNDNPAYISRTTDYLATSFPNGTTMLVKHYRTHAENWDGGFSRNAENDAKALAVNPLPSDTIVLEGLKVNGHEVTYRGSLSVLFRTGADGSLAAFEGQNCSGISLDGHDFVFSAQPAEKISYYFNDDGTYSAIIKGTGSFALPLPNKQVKKVKVTGQDNKVVKHTVNGDKILLDITPALSGQKLTIKIME
jgi:hypothetical protein